MAYSARDQNLSRCLQGQGVRRQNRAELWVAVVPIKLICVGSDPSRWCSVGADPSKPG